MNYESDEPEEKSSCTDMNFLSFSQRDFEGMEDIEV